MFARSGPTFKYNRKIINKKTRDFWGTNECCRRSRDQLYCKCPTELDGIKPILDGQYIWYELDSLSGYGMKSDMSRVVFDVGNSTPKFHGELSSGTAILLSSTGYIEIPMNSNTDSIVYYDTVKRSFVQKINTNDDSSFHLGSGIYNMIVHLSGKSFTEDDIVYFNHHPEDLLRWRFGESLNISIIYDQDDSLYACMEGEGNYIYEVGYEQNARALDIYGDTNIWMKNIKYGIQIIRTELKEVALPYDYITNNSFSIVNNGYDVIDFR